MEFSRPEYWSGWSFPSAGDLPNPGIKPRSPSLQADSLPVEPQGKPKNTGMGSLPLLQWIFLTQELNWGLLHCRQILCQLSYQGSPKYKLWHIKGWKVLKRKNKVSSGDRRCMCGLREHAAAAAAAKSFQSCLSLCDPIEGSPPGSPVSGIL